MLGEDEGGDSKSLATQLDEKGNFHDLSRSKNKTVSEIQWYPGSETKIALSVIENFDFEHRVKRQGKGIPSCILIFNNKEGNSTAETILNSPLEVTVLEFSPCHPNILVAGCINGQLIIWDLNRVEEKFQKTSE